MTRPGQHALDKAILRRIGRLVHLHLLTHPSRIARRYGVSEEYVRRQWRECHLHELASVTDALRDYDEGLPR